jgi:hypothetical protein
MFSGQFLCRRPITNLIEILSVLSELRNSQIFLYYVFEASTNYREGGGGADWRRRCIHYLFEVIVQVHGRFNQT